MFASRFDQSRARRRRLRARTQPLIALVPNIFTVMSLCAGLTSIRYALDARWELAVGFIILAGILDGLDGRSARLLKLQSNFGAQLDSLADFLSFGVAPAMLVYLWSLHQVRGFGWTLVLLFATCCALRLARFNTELDDPDQPAWKANFFTGIPAPAAAGCVMLPILAAFGIGADWPRLWPVTAAFTVFVALMMVSRVPTYSLKRIRVKPEWVLPTLVLAGLLVALLAHAPWLTLTGIGIAYLISLPFAVLSAGRLRRREAALVAARPAATAHHEAAAVPVAAEVPQQAGHAGTAAASAAAPAEAASADHGAAEASGEEEEGGRRIVRLGGRAAGGGVPPDSRHHRPPAGKPPA